MRYVRGGNGIQFLGFMQKEEKTKKIDFLAAFQEFRDLYTYRRKFVSDME